MQLSWFLQASVLMRGEVCISFQIRTRALKLVLKHFSRNLFKVAESVLPVGFIILQDDALIIPCTIENVELCKITAINSLKIHNCSRISLI